MMLFRISTLSLCVVLVSLAFGCDRGAPTPKAAAHEGHSHEEGHHADHHAQHAAAEPAPDANAGPAGPRIETDAFALEVASLDPIYKVGKGGQVAIKLESRGDWHVNEEFPIRVDIATDPSIELASEQLVKDDATEFTDEKVSFVTKLEPSKAGEHEVSCDVSFAMCTDDNCVLEKRTVAMQVQVR